MRNLLLLAVGAAVATAAALAVSTTNSEASAWTVAPSMCGVDGDLSDINSVGMNWGRVTNYSTTTSARLHCGLGAEYNSGLDPDSATEELAWITVYYADGNPSTDLGLYLASFSPSSYTTFSACANQYSTGTGTSSVTWADLGGLDCMLPYYTPVVTATLPVYGTSYSRLLGIYVGGL
jgi:hypothetical protein